VDIEEFALDLIPLDKDIMSLELPDFYRAVLLLRDIDGYSTRETADALELSESAVRTRLHRARSALKANLLPTMGVKYLDDIL